MHRIAKGGHEARLLLSAEEATLLELHEATIERGLRTFYEVGKALLAIREARLYRATHGTFEAYCAARWGFSKAYRCRLMQEVAAVDNVNELVDLPSPQKENQARALITLEPEQQRTAWAEAVATAPDGKVTGKHVAATVKRLYPKFPRSPEGGTQPQAAEAATEEEQPDRTKDDGYDYSGIPADAVPNNKPGGQGMTRNPDRQGN